MARLTRATCIRVDARSATDQSGFTSGWFVAVDAFEWEGADQRALETVAARSDGAQMLVRAALFRTIRAAMVPWAQPSDRAHVHRGTVEVLEEMVD